MITFTSQPSVNTPASDFRLFQVLRILVAATPLYVFVSALRNR